MSERREMLRKLVKKYEKAKIKAEVTDMIPGIWDKLLKIAKKLKYPTRYVNNFTKRQRIGRATLEKYINLFEEMAKKKKVDILHEIKVLKKALNSDVVWDRIEKISYIPSKSKYVYDISVEGLETFATYEGIITHNTMRTFHVAGTAVTKVTHGLPKLVEIVDAKKTPENPEMTIYLKSKYNNESAAIEVAEKIIERNLSDVIKKISMNLEDGYVEIEPLDKKMNKKIVSALKGLKNVRIRERETSIVIKPKGKFTTKDLEKLKEEILSLTISPVKGITGAIVMQEGKDWIIKTIGSNLEDVLKIEEVDPTRTVTTNIHEVAKVLGIEAARNMIIREITRTLNEQGLDVDIRHVTLLADIMTYTGKIRPIGRYGIAGTKTSVLAKAAFEETIKHLIKAAARGETEEFKGIFENVLIGKVIPAGTGMFELIAKTAEEEGK
jgi:DNA-directed RNA polymerase subunit A"